MRFSYKDIQNRQEEIIRLLELTPSQTIDVQTLASKLNVSPMTIRRDLDKLDKMGRVERVHGGAILKEKSKRIQGVTDNDAIVNIQHHLAERATKYIQDDSTIFLNSSTTTALVPKYLEDHIGITIVTNNLHIYENTVKPSINIILSGGEVRYPKEVLVGDIAVNNFSTMSSNMTIIGCSGISAERGLGTNNIHESKVNEVMIQNTMGLVIVLADYRKIGANGSFPVAPITDIDVLITDTFANPEAVQAIEDTGVRVIQINCE